MENKDRPAIQYKEGQKVLFESVYRVIPFNIVMSILLSVTLIYNHVPVDILLVWIVLMTVVCIIRRIHCKAVLKNELYNTALNFHLKWFTFLVTLTGILWTIVYFIAIPYTEEPQQYLILLVCAVMSTGSTSTLSLYFPALLGFILSIFIPVMIYNYSLWDINSAIFATMAFLFLLAMIIISRTYQRLLKSIFFLTEQNKVLMSKFEILSITDSLTGLYNRRYFNTFLKDEFNRARRNQRSFALISIDVDNFKLINDNLGHPFGDKFLTHIANHLRAHLQRANDIIFRLGGDEFSIILLNVTEEQSRTLCDQIKADFLITPPFEYQPKDDEHQKVLDQVSLSIGIVFVPYYATVDLEKLLETVDHSLYESKHEGKNQIRFSKYE